MKCPDCGHKLHGIAPCSEEEWVCDNPDCPANKDCGPTGAEYYGRTQKEINEQKKDGAKQKREE